VSSEPERERKATDLSPVPIDADAGGGRGGAQRAQADAPERVRSTSEMRRRMGGPRSLWRHRDFRLLWGGQTVSRLGSQVSILAVPLVAIQLLHASTFEVGLLSTFETLPFLLVGLPAGAWVDRMARRPVLIAADVGRAALLATVPVARAAGVLGMGQLYAVALSTGVLTVFFDVAYQSYLPALVTRDQLVDGNSKLAATDSGAQVVGPGAGGALIGAIGAASAVVADAASFVVSCLSLVLIRTREERHPRTASDHPRTTLRSEITEGLRFVLREPRIRSVAGATGTANLFSSMLFAVLLVFAVRQMGLGPGRLGLVFAIGNVGALVGALTGGRIARRVGVGPTILWSMVLCGVGNLAFPVATPGTATLLLVTGTAVTGAASVVYNISQVSMRQALCPLPLQGRMNASVRCIIWGTMPVGAFLGGVLGTWLGLRTTLWMAAGGGLGAFLWILRSPVPGIRDMPGPVDGSDGDGDGDGDGERAPVTTAEPAAGEHVEAPSP
jgi:MFS family permease